MLSRSQQTSNFGSGKDTHSSFTYQFATLFPSASAIYQSFVFFGKFLFNRRTQEKFNTTRTLLYHIHLIFINLS